jgi:hypothetical protein
MCDTTSTPAVSLIPAKQPFSVKTAWHGSRRRRLWELSIESHCPVIGVCLPLPLLRQITQKLLGEKTQADDYELHVSAVNACGVRNRMSDTLQDELDQRYTAVIRQFKSAKTLTEVASLWQQAVDRGEIAGALWATLTHPRCDTGLAHAVCQEMHMIQHQAGATARIERRRLEALQHENAVLGRELAKVQERCTRLLQDKNQEIARLNHAAAQMNDTLIARDITLAHLRTELTTLKASVPELELRQHLQHKLELMTDRLFARDKQVALLRRDLAIAKEEITTRHVPATPPAHPVARISISAPPVLTSLKNKTVLCVGGRSGNIANYRGVIEQVGGRFAHHDGGQENNASLLDASLAAADLIICQTGCISHNAYWRVKDHCRRTGKRCVFVDNPSISSLSRSLSSQLGPIPVRDITLASETAEGV